MSPLLVRQYNLMLQAKRYYEDIKAIERNFNVEDVFIQIQIESLQEKYAETVTELAKLLMTDLNIISIT